MNAEVMAIILIDEPKGVYYGGTVAGAAMNELLQNILPAKSGPKVCEEEGPMPILKIERLLCTIFSLIPNWQKV